MTYPQFLQAILEPEKFTFFDGTDTWLFKTDRTVVSVSQQTLMLLAENEDGESSLAINATDNTSEASLFTIESGEACFFALSLTELFYRKDLVQCYSKLKQGKWKPVEALLEQYKECPGCLYWIASGLLTSAYDSKRYNPANNRVAAALLEKIAAQNDPRACRDLADYHTWETEDAVSGLKWRIKAAELGDNADKKDLADFIIDELPDKIDLALEMLNSLKTDNHATAWCNWKEANIFLKGIGKPVDLEKGISLLQKAAEQESPMAMVDLAYFAYHGIGLVADKARAISLLEKANSLSDNQYIDILNKLKTS